MFKTLASLSLLSIVMVCCVGGAAAAEEATKLELADGKVIFKAPAQWKKEKPRSSIVTYEFSAPADAKDGEAKARITVMPSGGSIEANIERWYGQFEQPGGKSTKDVAKVEKFEAGGQTVHLVDITGNFKDTMGGGPFSGGKTVLRENYRMLGAIIVTKEAGNYYVKITGEKDVVEKLKDDFKKALKELEAQ